MFDTVFANSISIPGYQYVLSYALRIHDGNDFKTYKSIGRPILYRQGGAHEFLPITFVQRNVHYPSIIRKQRKALLREARAAGNRNVDPKSIIQFCINYCISGPIFVVFSGKIDLRYLSGIVYENANPLCACKSTAFYYSEYTQLSYCQLHAKSDIITHFTRLNVINMQVNTKSCVIRLCDKNMDIHSDSFSLTSIHSSICSIVHGDAHDPNIDTYFTFCLLKHYFKELAINFDHNRSNKYYNYVTTELKQKSLLGWLADNIHLKGKLCELGGGSFDIGLRKHNVDIKYGQDMNHHICDIPEQLLIDSVYYLDTINKPSYLYFDGSPNHYLLNYNGLYSYSHSRHANYTHQTVPSYRGDDLWRTPCSNQDLDTIKLATPVQSCHTKLNGDLYSSCSRHSGMEQTEISYLKFFSHQWIKAHPVEPGVVSVGTVNNANFILNKLLSTITLVNGCQRLFAGAAGGDMDGDATIGDMAVQFQRFIPDLTCLDIRPIANVPSNIKYVQLDIAKFKSNAKLDLIISDIWSRELIFHNIYSVCNSNLILGGTLVYSVNRVQILNLCSYFSDVQVLRPPSAHGSEIFVFCFNYTKVHNLHASIEANIYYLFRNLNAGGFKNIASLTHMNRSTCAACYG